MCWVEKCCFILPMDIGCLILGVTTFITSLISATLSIILLCVEETDTAAGLQYFHAISHLNLNASSIKIILCTISIVELIWMVFSVMLIIGIYKNKPNFVLCYFGFGIMMAILWSLSGLLVLLKNHWVMSMIKFVCVCVYTHCLIVVHSTYEQMLSGKLSRFVSHHSSDQTILVGSDLPESDFGLSESQDL